MHFSAIIVLLGFFLFSTAVLAQEASQTETQTGTETETGNPDGDTTHNPEWEDGATGRIVCP